MPPPKIPTIDYGDLEPSEDHLALTYQGRDFTGTAIERDRYGNQIAEVEFRDGKKSGLSREWFSDGSRRSEEAYAFGVLHGHSWEWYENGAMKAEGFYEMGICLRKREWSADGLITDETVLREGSPQYQVLLLLRAGADARAKMRVTP